MSIKRVLLDLLTADQLKDICIDLEVDADRRSRDSMVAALRSAKRAKPEKLVPHLTVPQLREALGALEEPADGRKEDLVMGIHEILEAYENKGPWRNNKPKGSQDICRAAITFQESPASPAP